MNILALSDLGERDIQAIWALVVGGVSFFIAAAMSLRVREVKA